MRYERHWLFGLSLLGLGIPLACGGKLLPESATGGDASFPAEDGGGLIGSSSGTTSSSSGVGSSSGPAGGSSSGSKPGTTTCGDAICDNATQVCCLNVGGMGGAGGVAGGGTTPTAGMICTAPSACMGATIACTGPSSCSDHQACCFTLNLGGAAGGLGGLGGLGGAAGGGTAGGAGGNFGSATCMTTCPTGSYQLCASNTDCPKGDTCNASPFGAGSYCGATNGAGAAGGGTAGFFGGGTAAGGTTTPDAGRATPLL
jgi:hypothetical protein